MPVRSPGAGAHGGGRRGVSREERFDGELGERDVESGAERRHGAEEREFCAFVADAERHDNAAGSGYLAIAFPYEAIDWHRGQLLPAGEKPE